MNEEYDSAVSFILGITDKAIDNYIFKAFSAITEGATPLLTTLLTLYMAIMGYAIWRGKLEINISEFMGRSVRLLIALLLFRSWPLFNEYIVYFFTEVPDAWVGKISGNGQMKASDAVDTLFEAGMISAGAIWKSSGIVTPLLLSGITIIITAIQCSIALFLLVLSKIGIAILLGMAPLFLILAIYPATQKMFVSYVQQLINFLFTFMLTIAMMTLIVDFSLMLLSSVTTDNDVGLNIVGSILLSGLVTTMLLKQIPSIASALAGGIGIQEGGALSGAYNSFARTVNGGGQRAKQAGIKTGRGAKHAYNAYRNRSRNKIEKG